jgi:flagellar assembly protein FliH
VSSEGRKYFFDLNNFDGSAKVEPEEDLPPPPPMFSVEELQEAQKISFEEGRSQGHKEEKQSRENYISIQISELNTQILSLVLAEQIREKRFEQEVIHLCRSLIAKIFPALTKRGGYDEIEDIISKVILKQTASKIVIEVPIEDVADIQSHLSKMTEIDASKWQIIGNQSLGRGNCTMTWQDGGAIRDHCQLVEAIFNELDTVLAPPPAKVHNTESNDDVDSNGDQNA